MKVPLDIAADAIQIIVGIMERADSDGPAAQINLGPGAVGEMRAIVQRLNEVNKLKAKNLAAKRDAAQDPTWD